MPTITISLRAARVNANKKIDEVANYIGVSRRTIINWESGVTVPDYDKAIKMADFYQIDLSHIFFGRNIALSNKDNFEQI